VVAGGLVPRNFSHRRLRHRKLGMGASSCSTDGVATRMTLFPQPSGGLIVVSFGNIGSWRHNSALDHSLDNTIPRFSYAPGNTISHQSSATHLEPNKQRRAEDVPIYNQR